MLCDFGSSRDLQARWLMTLMTSPSYAGTLPYCPPEAAAVGGWQKHPLAVDEW